MFHPSRDSSSIQQLADNGFEYKEKRKYAMKIKTKHQHKFDNLLDEATIRLQRPIGLDEDKIIKNLSRRCLTSEEKGVLALGLNYAVTPKTIPKNDIVAAVENTARFLPPQAAADFRLELKRSHPPITN